MVYWLFILMGLVAIGGQVLLLRRVLVSFTGNELTVAALLFAWTAWTGLGSLLGGRLSSRCRDALSLFQALFAITWLLLPATYVAAYLVKPIMGVELTEAVGPLRIVISSVILLCPLCVSLGALFPVGARLAGESPGLSVGRTYLWEALGAGLGGLFASAVLLPYMRPLASVLAFDVLVAVSMGMVSSGARRFAWVAAAMLAAGCMLWHAPDALLQSSRWRGFPLTHQTDSRYANLALVQGEHESTLFVDGSPSVTWPARAPAEHLALLPLVAHPRPERVLLVGGGETVIGAEILKASDKWLKPIVRRLDYCQIDPAIIEMEALVAQSRGGFQTRPYDRRVRIHLKDGRRFIREAAEGTYDVIILAGGDPHTLAQNRYFTREMFASIRRALARPGVMGFATGEYANYVEPLQARYLASIRATLETQFDDVAVYPLGRFYFLGGLGVTCPRSAEGIMRALDKLEIETRYFRPEFLAFNLSPERLLSVQEALESVSEPLINGDFQPVGYAHWTAYWSTLFSRSELVALRAVQGLKPLAALCLLAVLLVAGVVFMRFRAGRHSSSGGGVAALVAGVGFGEMVIGVAILYAAQVRFGTLFSLMGYLITALMVGLSLGAGIMCRLPARRLRGAILALTMVMILLPIAMIPALSSLLMSLSDVCALLLLTALAFGCSAVSGALFAGSARLEQDREMRVDRLGGRINAADLMGGSAGALLGGTVMIPMWGFSTTLLITSAAMVTGAVVWLARRSNAIISR